MKKQLYVRVSGMYCEHCVQTVKKALEALDGAEKVSVEGNVAKLSGTVLPTRENIITAVRDAGYETDDDSISTVRSAVAKELKWYEILAAAAVIVVLGSVINRIFGFNVFNMIPSVDSSVSFGMLFVIGLLTSIHCLSMCGAIGLCVSSEKNEERSIRRPLLYNAGRVLSYSLIGGIVGLAGSVFNVSARLRGVIVLAAGMMMLLMALSMLGIIRFSLPRFFKPDILNRRSGAFVIGLLNGFMPCGPLQAMQLYALSTGSFLYGALSMLLFSLGTVPLMIASGAAVSMTRGKARNISGKLAPVLILVLAAAMLNRGLLGLGVDITRLAPDSYDGYTASVVSEEYQTVHTELDYDSFGDIVVQVGIPVRLTIYAAEDKITGCNNEAVCEEFGFDVNIKAGENTVEFTPEKEGEYTYTCWMNMITNRIKVIDDIDYFEKNNEEETE